MGEPAVHGFGPLNIPEMGKQEAPPKKAPVEKVVQEAAVNQALFDEALDKLTAARERLQNLTDLKEFLVKEKKISKIDEENLNEEIKKVSGEVDSLTERLKSERIKAGERIKAAELEKAEARSRLDPKAEAARAERVKDKKAQLRMEGVKERRHQLDQDRPLGGAAAVRQAVPADNRAKMRDEILKKQSELFKKINKVGEKNCKGDIEELKALRERFEDTFKIKFDVYLLST